MCKKYGNKSVGFVNAILRKIDKDDLKKLNEIKDQKQRISKTTSMPFWIVEELSKEMNTQKVEKICKNSNIKPKMTIRVNNLKINKEELKHLLEIKNIEVEKGLLEDFLYLKNVKNITNLEEYKKGLFTLQDEAAGLTSIILDPKPEEKVLDTCSAPGGKTTFIAQLMENKGEIIAWDLYENRILKVKENAKRLGINIINAKQNDASFIKEEYLEKFDKILIDAPCLGLGVIRRKPDIKWQKKYEDISKIQEIQINILETCSKYLKKDGILVYSTCSIIKAENDKIIQKFIKNNKFQLTEIKNKQIDKIKNKTTQKGIIKLYPDENLDGFFIAKLQKKND